MHSTRLCDHFVLTVNWPLYNSMSMSSFLILTIIILIFPSIFLIWFLFTRLLFERRPIIYKQNMKYGKYYTFIKRIFFVLVVILISYIIKLFQRNLKISLLFQDKDKIFFTLFNHLLFYFLMTAVKYLKTLSFV